MGTVRGFTKAAGVLQRGHRDGQPFQHMRELLRDAALNGATECVFDIEHQALNRSVHRAARRMVRDDAVGMSYDTLSAVYADFGDSATVMDSPYLPHDADPDLHGRYGIGGRASTFPFNGYGYVTVTVQDGDAFMVWHYRGSDGEPRTRTFEFPDGSRQDIVPPYIEQDYIFYDVDPEFSELLLGLGMPEVELEDDDGNVERGVTNPEAGFDWAKVLTQHSKDPKGVLFLRSAKSLPIADKIQRRKDGTVRATLKGKPAHGTAKVMLGESPDDDTGITGDPYWRQGDIYGRESSADDYGAFFDKSTWDLPIYTEVVGLLHRKDPTKHRTWELEVKDPQTGNTTTQDYSAQGRYPVGVLSHLFGESGENIEWTNEGMLPPLVVDEHGTTLDIYVLDENTDGLDTNWKVAGRQGFVGIYYNNEIYERTTDPRTYRHFGVGQADADFRKRLVFIFSPPVADQRLDSYQEGVMNNTGRSELKWLGGRDIHVLLRSWADAYMQQRDDLYPDLKALYPTHTAAKATIDDPKFRKKFVELFKKVSGEFRDKNKAGGRTGKKKPEWMKDPKAVKSLALITDRGSTPMTDEGVQGVPGDTPKQPINCDLCNGVLRHEDGCPNKKEGGGPGGTNGTNHKGIADPDGTLTGGISKASVKPKVKVHKPNSAPEKVDLLPPVVNPVGAFPDGPEAGCIFTWAPWSGDQSLDPDGPAHPDPIAQEHAGVIEANLDLTAVGTMLIALDQGTNTDTKGMGNQYLINHLQTLVIDNPDYMPEDVLSVAWNHYRSTVIQAVIVGLAQRGSKIQFDWIKENFLSASSLTATVFDRANLDSEIQAEINKLPKRGVVSVPAVAAGP